MFFHCPILKHNILEELKTPERAMMLCKVTNENTGEILFEETRNINLLANDEMLLELKDVRSNIHYDLHQFICAWVTPHDKEGLIQQVRTEAAKLKASGAFGDFSSGGMTLGDISEHAKAVYDHLASQGFRYISQPFSALPQFNSQKVVLPEVALKNKAGNCIDLVVLFASILEGIGIYSLIFLTPDHAFIGWGNKNDSREIVFLETTAIGRVSFEEASRIGKQTFDDRINFKHQPEGTMLITFLIAEKGCHIIDTQEIRHSGKVSARSV